MNEESPENNNSDSPPPSPALKSASPSWKLRLQTLKTKLLAPFKKENLQRAIQNFDPQTFVDGASKIFQKQGAAFYGILLTVLLSTYFISDLTALVLSEYIPVPPANKGFRLGNTGPRIKTISDYSNIFSRNLFNSRGLIPGDIDENSLTKGADLTAAPVKTTLPMNLIGTLIMSDELRSIATIEDKAASMVFPVQVDDEIPGKIKIIKVEPKRVTFLNRSSGRPEYLELPEDLQNQNVRLTPGKPAGSTGVEKISATQFNVAKPEVDKALADFNNILTQARAIPNLENGVAAGYKLLQIVPGSIYDKLGLQNGDVITGLNGQPMNDPGKAFEMLNELKTSNHLELQLKKDGKTVTYIYDIH